MLIEQHKGHFVDSSSCTHCKQSSNLHDLMIYKRFCFYIKDNKEAVLITLCFGYFKIPIISVDLLNSKMIIKRDIDTAPIYV